MQFLTKADIKQVPNLTNMVALSTELLKQPFGTLSVSQPGSIAADCFVQIRLRGLRFVNIQRNIAVL